MITALIIYLIPLVILIAVVKLLVDIVKGLAGKIKK